MAQNLYITGAEHGSGKSALVLALMEHLAGQIAGLGFFRPVIRTPPQDDPLIRLVSERYALAQPPEALYGCTYEEARQLIASDRYHELIKRILERYKALEAQCELVVCGGTDYTSAGSVLELDFNADVANNLGCLVMPVVNGHGRSAGEIIDAAAGFEQILDEHGCEVLATVINRVADSEVEAVQRDTHSLNHGAPVYVIPEQAALAHPTVADIAQALGARLIFGEAGDLNREVLDYKVAAMEVPDFLDYLSTGSLVITPGDRADIILASLISYPSTAYPPIAGLLLSGGQEPAPPVRRLIEGLGKPPVPMLGVGTDTFTTAMNVSKVSAVISPQDERKIAMALGVVEAHVDLPALQTRLMATRSRRITPLMFEYELIQRAKRQRRHIVLPEGAEERILRAAQILRLRGVADLTLLGDREAIEARIQALDLHLEGIDIIDPLKSPLREQYAQTYYELRRHKGIAKEMAYDTLADVSYFGTLMVHHGHADGMVSGSVHTTQHTIRPAFEVIKTQPGFGIVSSVFFMCLEDRVLVYGDCAVNPNPNAEQLADIAINAAQTARMFGIEPRIAMLSYSTGASGKGEAVDKVAEATRIARGRRPDLKIEGPIQYDAAVDASVAKTKLPESEVAGTATVFIFPDLNTGNNTYKAVQRSAGAVAVGPILQGLNKPVNDLSRGCTVTDIVNTVAITAIQAQTPAQTPE